MKKILIYKDESTLKPVGGPSGYLYGLRKGLNAVGDKDISICFLQGKGETAEMAQFKQRAKTSRNAIVKPLLHAFRRLKHIKYCISSIYSRKKAAANLNDYDAVHFHTSTEMYALRDELRDYKGKVIFTSHSPQPLSHECIEGSSKMEIALFGRIYKKMIRYDEYAFNRADYIFFPCESAGEPYEHAWPQYSEIKTSKKEQYRYLLSGVGQANITKTRDEVRNELGIPADAFVISYVGRHNEIKGYGRFIDICLSVQKTNPNVYVVVAGNIGPLFPPADNDRWIEIGWTTTPHNYIAAADLFILANKETYFDLVLLEVLSIGTPVIASRTGGNKHFEQEPSEVRLFDSNDEAIGLVNEFIKMDEKVRDSIRQRNKELYQSNFTLEVFARNYVSLLKKTV